LERGVTRGGGKDILIHTNLHTHKQKGREVGVGGGGDCYVIPW
jgi:hypothetical protein